VRADSLQTVMLSYGGRRWGLAALDHGRLFIRGRPEDKYEASETT